MGVFKRYRDAQAAQKDAENAMPGAYQSNYTDRINEALDSMGAASNAGYDVGTDSELYRQYRAGAQANARAAAENAAAGAAALSGGYGSSYANSVAQQGYQQAMANVDSGLSGLRDKALTMYQLKQNGLSGLLSALQSQDSLEAAEHQGAVANAQDWRDYKKSRADQAAQEKSDFLSNLWEMAKSVGRAGLTAYDTYKGYTQQQWENEFAREQWEYNKERTGQSDALNAYEQAFNLYQQGAGDAANAVLGRYGLDTGIFDNYSGAPITRADKAGALTTAAGLAGGGSDEAARAVLELYGLDPNSVGDYRTIAGRQLATALYKNNTSGSSGSGRRSGGSGGSSGSRSSGSTGNKRPAPTYFLAGWKAAENTEQAQYRKPQCGDWRRLHYDQRNSETGSAGFGASHHCTAFGYEPECGLCQPDIPIRRCEGRGRKAGECVAGAASDGQKWSGGR